MKRVLSPRTKDSKANVPASAKPETAERAPVRFSPRGGEKNRILVAVSDGLIDFRAMAPEASHEFNSLMHTPEVQAQFGIGPLSQRFDPEHCKRFYEAFGHVLQTIGHMAMRWPPEVLRQLEYSEKEKDELAKPTAAALDEIAPKWVKENQAVVAFFVLFGTITQNKLRMAAMSAYALKQKSQSGEPGKEPIPVIRIPVSPKPASAAAGTN
jgi:hypothetical protein